MILVKMEKPSFLFIFSFHAKKSAYPNGPSSGGGASDKNGQVSPAIPPRFVAGRWEILEILVHVGGRTPPAARPTEGEDWGDERTHSMT